MSAGLKPDLPAGDERVPAGSGYLDSRLLPVAVFGLLAFFWMWPSSLSPADTISDVGDPLHLAYIMAWNAHQLLKDPLRLFDANSFYPWPQSLAFADHLLPESLLVAPVQWISGNAVLGYNVAVFLGLVLSALFMRLLILEATHNSGAALVAGVVYAFNGFTLVEANRVQVIHLQWWPLALLFLGRFVEKPAFGRALGFFGALALQGLSGSYYLAYSALVTPVWLILAFASRTPRPTWLAAKRLAGAAALCALPVALVIAPYLARGLPQSRVSAGVDLLAYLSPRNGSLLFGTSPLPLDPLGREFKGVVGLILIGLGVVASIRSRPGWFRSLGAIAFVTGGIGVIMSMGGTLSVAGSSFGPGPQRLLVELLPLEGLRHTPRFNALAVLGGSVLAGLGMTLWSGHPRRTAVALALCAILPLEHWAAPGYGTKLPKSADLRSAYADLPSGPLVDLPLFPITQRRYWAAYPFLSTYHWNPVLIGRTSFYPPGHEFLAWLLSRFPDPISHFVLSQLDVRTLVVHPLGWPAAERPDRLREVEGLPGLVRMDRRAVSLSDNILNLGDERYYQLSKLPEGEALCEPGAEAPADAIRVYAMGATTVEEGLDRLTDRDPATRWSSGRDQAGWYGFQVRLSSPRRLAAVVIETPSDRFPRVWPSLEIRAPAGAWTASSSLFTPETAWETLQGQLRGESALRMVVRFKEQEVRAFRLTFASYASPPTPHFEVSELRVFGECIPLPGR